MGWLDSQRHLKKHKPDVEHVCEHETGVWISAFSKMFTAHGLTGLMILLMLLLCFCLSEDRFDFDTTSKNNFGKGGHFSQILRLRFRVHFGIIVQLGSDVCGMKL